MPSAEETIAQTNYYKSASCLKNERFRNEPDTTASKAGK